MWLLGNGPAFAQPVLGHCPATTAQVLVAENGEQALRTFDQSYRASPDPRCPRLLLLDLNMPVLNGLGFLEAYAQLPLAHQQRIVIVLFTTSLHLVDLARAQQLPLASFLNKPPLQERVTACCQQHVAPPYA